MAVDDADPSVNTDVPPDGDTACRGDAIVGGEYCRMVFQKSRAEVTKQDFSTFGEEHFKRSSQQYVEDKKQRVANYPVFRDGLLSLGEVPDEDRGEVDKQLQKVYLDSGFGHLADFLESVKTAESVRKSELARVALEREKIPTAPPSAAQGSGDVAAELVRAVEDATSKAQNPILQEQVRRAAASVQGGNTVSLNRTATFSAGEDKFSPEACSRAYAPVAKFMNTSTYAKYSKKRRWQDLHPNRHPNK